MLVRKLTFWHFYTQIIIETNQSLIGTFAEDFFLFSLLLFLCNWKLIFSPSNHIILNLYFVLPYREYEWVIRLQFHEHEFEFINKSEKPIWLLWKPQIWINICNYYHYILAEIDVILKIWKMAPIRKRIMKNLFALLTYSGKN